MIPGPWIGIVLALAVFRLYRLLAYDDFPPVERARAWVLGEKISKGPYVDGNHYVYDRPLLAKFWQCPFCLGFWLSAVVYVLWIYWPTGTLYGSFAFALSGAVGLITKQLDP